MSTSVVAVSLVVSLLVSPHAFAQKSAADGVQGVGKMSSMRGLASEEQLEAQALQQYTQLKQQSAQSRSLAPADHPQLVRIRTIAQKLIPFSLRWNERASKWQWEVNLIGSKEINAFCMPGGKIAFYTGILDTLKLTDDEVALVMGHEIAHALREHGRERAGKQTAAAIGTTVLDMGSQLLGFGSLGRMAGSGISQMSLLAYGRDDETEADLIGLDIAARAGFDPRAGVTLWQKMGASSKGAPPQWLSTHPSGKTRIQEITKHLPEVLPLYAKTKGMVVEQLQPYQSNWSNLAAVK